MIQIKLVCNNRYAVYSDGRIQGVRTGKYLKPTKTSEGLLTVPLHDGSVPGRSKKYFVNRLIAEAFLGASSLQVKHKDGNAENNNVSNLAYVPAKSGRVQPVKVVKKQTGSKVLTTRRIEAYTL